jgi:hypothetical protein
VGEIEASERPTTAAADGGDYDDWDNEGYFFVRNKNDPLELHTKQVQKIFGAYSIHVHSLPLPSRARVVCVVCVRVSCVVFPEHGGCGTTVAARVE